MSHAKLEELSNRLSEREATIFDALEGANIGIWEWNTETNSLFWDHRMMVLYDISPDEFHGTYDDWRNAVHSDDIGAAEESLNRCVETGSPYIYSFRVKLKDGGWRQIVGRGKRITDRHGKMRFVSGVCYEPGNGIA
jgi:PAS domain-containing protein